MAKASILYSSLLLFLLIALPNVRAEGKVFTVVIDAGHGGKDPGARGGSVNEKTINLAVALKVGNLIAARHNDVKVIYTRKTDVFVDLDERANIANRNKADLFISIHTNSVKRGSSVAGTETYTLGLARSDENLQVAMRENSAILLEDNYLQKYEGFDPNSSESYIIFEFMQNKHMEQSIHLASEVQKCFTAAKRNNRGVRQAGFLVLRKTSMPSVLIELGYISNPAEERFMKSKEGQNKLAESISKAFTTYKQEFDRRLACVQPSTRKDSNPTPSASISKQEKGAKGVVVYKVQILTSDKKLPSNSKVFKGYKNVSYFKEKGLYKYTYGETNSFNEIRKLRRQVAKDFKDAFIVAFQDGEKVNY